MRNRLNKLNERLEESNFTAEILAAVVIVVIAIKIAEAFF